MKKSILVLLVIVLVVLGGLLFLKNSSGYAHKEISADGFVYSFKFDKSAQEVTINNQPYLQGKEKNSSTVVAVTGKKTDAPVIKNCSDVGTSWTTAFTSHIEGSDYLVCSANQTTYATTVQKDGVRHLVEVISQDKQTKLNEENTKSIFDSVTIN